MEAQWGHLCLKSEMQGPFATLQEVIDSMDAADPRQSIALPPFELALRLFASIADGPDNHVFQVVLTDAADQLCDWRPMDTPLLPFIRLQAGYPLIGGARVRIEDAILPRSGAYSFDCVVDEVPVFRLPFTAYSMGDRHIQPKRRNTDPIRLEWMHFVRKYKPPNSAGVGTIVLVDIMEFLVLPPHRKDINLRGAAVILEIDADHGTKPDHDLRVELLDGDGHEVLPPYHRTITLKEDSPSVMKAIVPVKLASIVLNADEGYQVRAYLDGAPIGIPQDLRVLKV